MLVLYNNAFRWQSTESITFLLLLDATLGIVFIFIRGRLPLWCRFASIIRLPIHVSDIATM